MRVAVIDIGSNTARRVCDLKLAETAERARGYARKARELGATAIDVIVTAPGRQSENADELLGALRRATGAPVRVLSADEEGRLAYEGALAQSRSFVDRVAVCDVGGGSTELVVGSRSGVEFCRSLDIGSVRIARRFLDGDPPGKKAIAAARAEIAEQVDALNAPAVGAALATGGSARSLRKLTGSRVLGERELASALKTVAKSTSSQIAQEAGLDPLRAQTLLAGTLILAETQRRLGVPLEVARGGLREGAAYGLLTQAPEARAAAEQAA